MSLRQTRILIIEDDLDLACLLKYYLETDPVSAHDVRLAGDLTVGLGALAADDFDAVVLDLNLPESEGMDAFFRLAVARIRQPIVVCTGEEDPAIERQCLEAGAHDFVRKTKLSKAGLRRALRQAIGRSRYEARYAPPLHAVRPATASASGVKVLLVEDDPAARRLLERRLSQMHFTVFSADSVASALSIAPIAAPDVALVDHELPDGTGLDVARAFARLPALVGVPLIMVSAHTDQDTVMRALASGINEYIQKPINVSELALRIHAMLSLSARQRRLSELNARLNREKALLARYISADVLQRALAAASGQGAPGWSGEAVVLVFDLRDSTRIAESMEARAFSELLSRLLNDLMDLVFSAHGFISKLTGDGFIATFGANAGADLSRAAGDAVDCAIRIRDYFQLVNEMRSQDEEDSLGYGVGVATGRLFTGDVGYERRMEYMALGPALTRAERLESFTKRAGVAALVDARTRKLDADRHSYKYCELRSLGGRFGRVYYPDSVRAAPEIQLF